MQNISQSKLAKSYKIPIEILDENFFACKLFSIILGGGTSSKLFKKVRIREGLAYHISAALSDNYGLVCICAGTENCYLKRVEFLIDETIIEMKNGLISDEEVQTAKLLYIQQLMKDFDKPFKTFKILRKFKIGINNFDMIQKKIMDIRKEDVLMVSNNIEKVFTFILKAR